MIIALISIAGLTILYCLARWPTFPVVILYPLLWILGAYNLDFIGGRVERLIAIIGMMGVVFSLLRYRLPKRMMPLYLQTGIIFLLVASMISWLLHLNLPDALETILSLISRILLLFLVIFHVRKESDVKTIVYLFLLSNLIGGLITLYLSFQYGFGFWRDFIQVTAVKKEVPLILQNINGSMNQATAAAVLLLGMYPWIGAKSKTWVLFAGVLFIFSMAFASQFRREILLTLPVVMLYFYFERRSGLARIALRTLIVSALGFFLYVLPTSRILQYRFETETSKVLEGKEARMVSFATGLKVFQDAPFFGHGPGSYRSVLQLHLPQGAESFASSAYNVFMWLLVESGFLGVIGMIIIIFGTFKYIKKLPRCSHPFTDLVIRTGPALMLLIIIWFSFGNAWDGSLPWFLTGLIVASSRIAIASARNNLQKTICVEFMDQ